MKRKLFSYLFLEITFLTFLSCNKEDDRIHTGKRPVIFSSTVAGEEIIFGKAAGTSWTPNDAIGVFMKKAGLELTEGNVLEDALNIQYITTNGASDFTPYDNSQVIFFPDGQSVDFIAYYPYRQDITGFTYKIDLTGQDGTRENKEKADLLYSVNAVNQGDSESNIPLSFKHQLSKIQFNVKTNDLDSSLDGLTVTISNVNTKADYSLINGQLTVEDNSPGSFKAYTAVSGATATAEAILLPTEGGDEMTVAFTLQGGSEFKHTFPAESKFEKGKSYEYDVTLKGNDGDIEENYGYFETPVKTAIDNTIFVIHHLSDIENNDPNRTGRNYSMLYDQEYKIAYWVAYPLHAYYLGSQSRTEEWQYDRMIDPGFQPYLKNGWGVSGIDRGHQIPSIHRNYNYVENATTFYYSNMTYQHGQLNQLQWRLLEEEISKWAKKSDVDTLYVVTGAMITTRTDKTIEYVQDNNKQPVAKPKYYYKALAQKSGSDYYTLAFKMNNERPSGGFNNYRLTVKELEEETGFTFFPSLNDEIKNTINTDRWK